jgi:hypothetical protein
MEHEGFPQECTCLVLGPPRRFPSSLARASAIPERNKVYEGHVMCAGEGHGTRKGGRK